MQPYWPRKTVDGKRMCPMCAQNEGFRMAASNQNHPHEVWQKSAFGCYHVSQGRHLPQHLGALSHEEQEERMRKFDAEEGSGPTRENSPFKPVHHLIQGARAYNAKIGLHDPHAQGYDHVATNVHAIRAIGREFDKLPVHQDHAIPHFEAMRDEVNHQYHHLTNRMGIKVESVDHDPYRNVHEMVHDVATNKRLKVLGTHVTGPHNLFSNEENDKFRAVHDAFGHAATGRGFDAHGEEAAFAAHSNMFTHHALPAMVSETRGQNAYLHLNGDFPEQKIAVLPKHMWSMATDLSKYKTGVRYAVRHRQGALDLRRTSPEQGLRHFVASDQPHIIRLAHDSGDSITVFHCPFCGSGQVIARSDGSIECEFCHSSFTVQVQPEFSAFPQTIGGVPVDVPGMGPDQQPMAGPEGEQDMGVDPNDPNADPEAMGGEAQSMGGDTGDGGFPPGSDDPEDDEEDDEESDEDAPPFLKKKKSYRTKTGAVLDFEHYLQHLALTTAADKNSVLRKIRTANRSSS